MARDRRVVACLARAIDQLCACGRRSSVARLCERGGGDGSKRRHVMLAVRVGALGRRPVPTLRWRAWAARAAALAQTRLRISERARADGPRIRAVARMAALYAAARAGVRHVRAPSGASAQRRPIHRAAICVARDGSHVALLDRVPAIWAISRCALVPAVGVVRVAAVDAFILSARGDLRHARGRRGGG